MDIVGFCRFELKPPGPVQVNVVAEPEAVRLNVDPEHTGLFELSVDDAVDTTVTLMVFIDKQGTPAVVKV